MINVNVEGTGIISICRVANRHFRDLLHIQLKFHNLLQPMRFRNAMDP